MESLDSERIERLYKHLLEVVREEAVEALREVPGRNPRESFDRFLMFVGFELKNREAFDKVMEDERVVRRLMEWLETADQEGLSHQSSAE